MTPRIYFPSFYRLLAATALVCIGPVTAVQANPSSAFEITQEISRSADRQIDSERLMLERLGQQVSDGIRGVQQALVEQESNSLKHHIRANPLDDVLTTFMALPLSNATVDQITQDVMFNRQREMNRIKIEGRDDYIIDTSLPASIDTQAFDIFMRYFCDPKARSGTMSELKIDKVGVKFGDSVLNYELGCGYTSNNSIPSRRALLGPQLADAGPEAEQVIGLPTRPEALFFEPSTFPTNVSGQGAPTDAGASNSNRLAHIYYAAFSQSLLFLLGEPPVAPTSSNVTAGSASAYIANQAAVTRKMMASYPFAIMFAERMGTMGPDAAEATANLLRTKLSVATEDENIFNMIQNIERRNTISQAEYMDVVMYQLMLSPGYYARINDELNSSELRREVVWLTAMQTALNYQRNRWLEILTALEAIR